jgi:hypothetical protein
MLMTCALAFSRALRVREKKGGDLSIAACERRSGWRRTLPEPTSPVRRPSASAGEQSPAWTAPRRDQPRVHAREKLDRDRAAVRRQQIAHTVVA